MIYVAAYVRSDRQSEKSIDAQICAIKRYSEKNDLNIVKFYIDSNSAKNNTNDFQPELRQMFEDSKFKMFEQVIVHSLDRFSRNRYDSVRYRLKLKKNSVAVRSVLENLNDAECIMMESILVGGITND